MLAIAHSVLHCQPNTSNEEEGGEEEGGKEVKYESCPFDLYPEIHAPDINQVHHNLSPPLNTHA